MPTKRVLSIGQCAADHGTIAATLRRHFHANVQPVDSSADALAQLRQGGFDLVLVNRIFDADGASGLEFIKQLKSDAALRDVPVMLVSNYDDSQRDAEQAGAAPGFGKAALAHPRTLKRLQPFLSE